MAKRRRGTAAVDDAAEAAASSRAADQGKSLAKSAAKAYEYIRVRILDGTLPPSSHLVEHILATEISVSRTPIREALRRLAADGFVTFVPNQGAKVVEWSEESLADLIDVRSELAGMAARLAAARISKAAIEELRTLNEELARVTENRNDDVLTEAARLNNAFHRVIFNASGNPWLMQLLEQTAYLPMIHRAHFAFDPIAWQHGIARYRDLIDAFSAGDGKWAESLIQTHFLAAKHLISHRRTSEPVVSE
jgi:DNA-binding GntR family transcriptional regulator